MSRKFKKTTHCSWQNYTLKSFQFRGISNSDFISGVGCNLLRLPYKNLADQKPLIACGNPRISTGLQILW